MWRRGTERGSSYDSKAGKVEEEGTSARTRHGGRGGKKLENAVMVVCDTVRKM